MTEEQFEKLRQYLDDDAQAHIRTHGKWWLDSGKLATALDCAGVQVEGRRSPLVDALPSFCDDVDSTGGLVHSDYKGVMFEERGVAYAPAGAPDWPDLALTYLEACELLGREPVLPS